MNEVFRLHVESLHGKYEQLIGMAPFSLSSRPKEMACPGIYLLSEGEKHHVGGPEGASFAFKLAKEKCGKQKATYTKEGSRKALMTFPDFSAAFDWAKSRIRQMDIRFVQEPDPNRQALLEIYVTLSLATPYNDFETH
jgi:hypothetical protein